MAFAPVFSRAFRPVFSDGAGETVPSTLLTGITAYWKLDEDSDGSAPVSRADSVGSATLTDNNTVPSIAAVVNNGADFTYASSDYLSAASSATLQTGDIDYTFSCWVYLNSLPPLNGIYGIITKDGATQREYALTCSDIGGSTRRFRFVIGDGAGNLTGAVNDTTIGTPTTGVWYFIVVWHDAANSKIWIQTNNGTAVSADDTGTPGVGAAEFRIGSRQRTSQHCDGNIDEVGFWKRILTATERASLFNSGIGNAYPFSTAAPYVFLLAGQSNSMGAGTNNQAYTHATLKAFLFGNDYLVHDLTDPTDINTNQVDAVSSDVTAAGSLWPLIATYILANKGRPCVFVPCANDGSAITEWQPGAEHQDRTTLYGSMVFRGLQVGNVQAVLWHQGEREARADIDMSAADYNAYLDAVANAVMDDLGCRLVPCKLQDLSTCVLPARDNTKVNQAIATAWADNSNVLTGPDFSDITPSIDGLHFKTDAELATAALRWWNAINTII